MMSYNVLKDCSATKIIINISDNVETMTAHDVSDGVTRTLEELVSMSGPKNQIFINVEAILL